MQRAALALTFVGLVVACIPAGPSGPYQQGAAWSAQPTYPNQPSPNQPEESDPYQGEQPGSAPPADGAADFGSPGEPTGRGTPATRGARSPRGFLGLRAEDAQTGPGLKIIDVLPGSPAASAGLRVGDRIAAVNGRPVSTFAELSRLSAAPPGAVLKLSVRRGARVGDVAVTLGQPPSQLPAVPQRSTDGARGRRPAPASGSSDSGAWHCRAVGTYARGTSGEGPDYGNKQNIDVTKYGATEKEAVLAAINECSEMLDLETVALVDSGNLVLEYCKAISCSR